MQETYLFNDPMFNLLFLCHIVLYREKVTSCEKFSHNLTLEIFQKFQRFNARNRSIEMLKNK